MAIHVRSTRRATKIWRELRIKLARLATIVAILFMLFTGVVMYLILIINPPPPDTSFTAWQEPTGGQEETEQQEARAAGAIQPVQVTVTPVIISMAEAIPLPDTIEVEFEDTDEIPDTISVDLGSGLGELQGDGSGSTGGGRGGRGTGRNRGKGSGGAMGYNDDVQVVLALDASGSMDRLFQAVSNSLEVLLRTLGECRINGQQASVNVGIVVYGQSQNSGAPFELTPFTLDLDAMQDKILSVNCDGAFESCGAAIDFALKNYPWNKRQRRQLLRVIFIAGNESFDQGHVNYRDALAAAQELGIIVNTIHCGESNTEWKTAARLGGGEGLTFDMNDAGNTPSMRLSRGALIEKLYNMPLLPLGSPAEQNALKEAHASRPALPNLADSREVNDWARQHLEQLLRGYRQDAVEQGRQLGDSCTVDALGGRGNLPPELRDLADETQILDTVKKLADERQSLIDSLQTNDRTSFIGKVLDTLIKQAAERGIEITR